MLHKVLEDISIIFFDTNNAQSQDVYRNKNDSCSCNVSRVSKMQYKHDICFNKKYNLTKNGKCWLNINNITQSSNKFFYNCPTIVRCNTMETDFQNEQFFSR